MEAPAPYDALLLGVATVVLWLAPGLLNLVYGLVEARARPRHALAD
jgi:hypothetical protein